jgi:carboxypeptidase C (cathepsin A)
MNLNGIVLMSSLLDFSTLETAAGNDLGYLSFLPSYTGVAHYHGKIKGNRDELVRDANSFAFGPYATALLKGSDLDEATRKSTAAELERFTGISSSIWIDRNLRMDPSVFRAELLRAEGKTIGRFDARVAWDSGEKSATHADHDPSFSLAYGAISSAMMDYLANDLGYSEDMPYEIITSVGPWNWSSQNQVVNVSDRLSEAMRDNPHLRVLVMEGYTDLATPPAGIEHSLRHLPDLPASARKRITCTRYDGGHMFYLNPPDLGKCRKDLAEFIEGGK